MTGRECVPYAFFCCSFPSFLPYDGAERQLFLVLNLLLLLLLLCGWLVGWLGGGLWLGRQASGRRVFHSTHTRFRKELKTLSVVVLRDPSFTSFLLPTYFFFIFLLYFFLVSLYCLRR